VFFQFKESGSYAKITIIIILLLAVVAATEEIMISINN
jgi:hypothetical protein